MRNVWVIGIILVLIILLPGALLIWGRQPPYSIEDTTSIKVLDTLGVIENTFPQKADELKQIVNDASVLEKELREQNKVLVFLFGYPLDLTRVLSQKFNETEEKLADIFSLAYSANNTEEIHESEQVVKEKMLEVWTLSKEFEKKKGIFGFLR